MDRWKVFVQSMRGFLYDSLLLGLRFFCGDISVTMFGEGLRYFFV